MRKWSRPREQLLSEEKIVATQAGPTEGDRIHGPHPPVGGRQTRLRPYLGPQSVEHTLPVTGWRAPLSHPSQDVHRAPVPEGVAD